MAWISYRLALCTVGSLPLGLFSGSYEYDPFLSRHPKTLSRMKVEAFFTDLWVSNPKWTWSVLGHACQWSNKVSHNYRLLKRRFDRIPLTN